MDTNNDGHIDYDEFLTAASNRSKLINKDNLKAAFKVFDKNDDGKITVDEIQTAFVRGNLTDLSSHGVVINDDLWKSMLADIDSN